ncbi:hypothetical protein EDD99_0032 [Streptomyces sp. 846.5]|nr:hypothetical protein EDD99_0032 [Streptomyces sp. 846.5]
MQPLTTPAPRRLPHPWDLHVEQCRGLRCVWCKTTLGDVRIPAGTTESVHQYGSAPARVVQFRVFSCPLCAEEGPS